MRFLNVFALLALFLLSCLSVQAGITDCAKGYTFDRMSGVGCVQTDCRSVPHAFYNYVGYCVCYACGEVGCSGDAAFSKMCKRSHDYASCPDCLYACISPNDLCPGEKAPNTPAGGVVTATTLKAQSTATTVAKPKNETIRVKVKGKMTAFGRPLKHVRLYCGDGKVEVTTDAEGNFEFEVEGLKDGEEFGCELMLEYVRDGKVYFQIHHQDNPDSITYYHTFKAGETGPQDLKLDELFKEGDPGSEAYVSAYVHMTEALEFYLDGLGEKLSFQLPLHVKLFMPDDPEKPKAAFNGDDGSVIEFQERASVQDAPGRQLMFYHEFSHYVMRALYGKWPHAEGNTPVKEFNHGGFINPSSSDSYVEGFAAFMSVMMMEAYGETVPSGKDYSQMSLTQLLVEAGKAPITDLETDYTAWERQGRMEEYAVAGVLWDLVDGEDYYKEIASSEQLYQNYLKWKKETQEFNDYTKREYPNDELIPIPEYDRSYFNNLKRDDDNVEFDADDVWKVLREYRGDFSAVHGALTAKFSNNKAKIDEAFAKHGFFADTRRGNGKYDEFEPYADKDKNGRYDEGEYFIDYSSEEPKYEAGMAVGSAANYQRAWRKTTQEIPGQYVKVNNNVPYYDVVVMFPNQPQLNYAYRTENCDGKIYMNVPPEGYNATIFVQAEGVTTGRPLSFSSEKFNQQYAQAVEKGYYLSHDFKVSGPIPEKAPVPKGTLPQKNKTQWLWIGVGGAAAMLIGIVGIAVVVAIILAILIIKKLKKKKPR